MEIRNILETLTTEEKAALVSGTDFMYTNPIPRLGLPSLRMADGPHGLRVQNGRGDNGIAGSEPATAFPTAACVASSWNPENAYRMGEAIAEECRHYGVDLLLGPGVCIKRNPLCGRNFEYFSEDPILSGKMAAAEVRGLQSEGIGASVKHFALNNAENYRFMGDSVCDMRAIREIYLKAFEIIVKESEPYTVMCAYNKINGEYCSENQWLLTEILRKEWGFSGAVLSDWGAVHDRVRGLKAGLDLEMPGDTAVCRRQILDEVRTDIGAAEALDRAAGNILKLIGRLEKKPGNPDAGFCTHHALAAKIAEDSAVLLKNDGGALPLKDEKILVAGDLFKKMRYQGAGSSMIRPWKIVSAKDAFDERGARYIFCRGYNENQTAPNPGLTGEAVAEAEKCEKILVFAGLTESIESEGADRSDMKLPENQLALIDALLGTGKQVIVVLYGGSPAELPFADRVSAILLMYLPGQNGGTAAANLLFGDKTPCGKLAETWPVSYADVPFGDKYSRSSAEVYRESVYVGYRYYLSAQKEVRYPFGFGLSYTSFAYDDLQVTEDGDVYKVSFKLKNCGAYDGAEIAQLYVEAPKGVFRPRRELKGFVKVYLKSGESKRAMIILRKEDLRYWNDREKCWVTESGVYHFLVCSDCRTVQMSKAVVCEGDCICMPYTSRVNETYMLPDPAEITDEIFEEMSGLLIPSPQPMTPIRIDSRFTDLRATFFGRILFHAVLGLARKQYRAAKRMPEGLEKENKMKGAIFLKRILESNSLSSMSMNAGKSLPYNVAQGLAALANGRIFRAIRCFCAKIKVPPLPKEEEEMKIRR